jgi:hypothetical protein
MANTAKTGGTDELFQRKRLSEAGIVPCEHIIFEARRRNPMPWFFDTKRFVAEIRHGSMHGREALRRGAWM